MDALIERLVPTDSYIPKVGKNFFVIEKTFPRIDLSLSLSALAKLHLSDVVVFANEHSSEFVVQSFGSFNDQIDLDDDSGQLFQSPFRSWRDSSLSLSLLGSKYSHDEQLSLRSRSLDSNLSLRFPSDGNDLSIGRSLQEDDQLRILAAHSHSTHSEETPLQSNSSSSMLNTHLSP